MKKLLSLLIALMVMISTSLSVSVNAFADENHYTAANGDEYYITSEWTYISGKAGLNYKGNTEFSVDTSVYYGDSRYSIKIKNTDYNASYAEKTFEVEPYTTYKFSAWVKYLDYELDPKSERKDSGACIGKAFSFNLSKFSTSKKWTKVEYIFQTGDETKYNLCLQNGMWGGAMCKGTAYFSDVKLEKAEVTNEWNVLAIAYKNTDVKVDLKGKTTVLKSKGKGLTRYKDSYTNAEIKEFKNVVKNMYTSVDELSGGLASVKDIDYITVTKPIDEVAPYDYDGDQWGTYEMHGYRMDEKSEIFTETIDKCIKKKNYNIIVILAPLEDIAGGWGGLNGEYKGIPFAIVSNMGNLRAKGFTESTIIHELLHQFEAKTRVTYDPEIPSLHARADYGYEFGTDGDYEWYRDYMRAKVEGNKGINKQTLWLFNGKYTLVDDDMTTSGDIKPAAKLSLSKCEIAEIDNQIYSGKKKTPAITITDGKYTLKKDIDYTVKYSNNKNAGKAKITVTGKGIYSGTLKAEFNILPKVKAKKNGNYITITVKGAKNADSISIWQSKDGKGFEQIKVLDGEETSVKLKCSKNHTYSYAVTAYIPESGYTSYVYTDTIKM